MLLLTVTTSVTPACYPQTSCCLQLRHGPLATAHTRRSSGLGTPWITEYLHPLPPSFCLCTSCFVRHCGPLERLLPTVWPPSCQQET